MVRHQTIGPYFDSEFSAPFGHKRKVRLIISFSKEGFHAPVPTLGNVVGHTGCYQSCNSRHEPDSILTTELVKN
jgi:hypothetical protein